MNMNSGVVFFDRVDVVALYRFFDGDRVKKLMFNVLRASLIEDGHDDLNRCADHHAQRAPAGDSLGLWAGREAGILGRGRRVGERHTARRSWGWSLRAAELDDIASILPHNTGFAGLRSAAVIAEDHSTGLALADLPFRTVEIGLAERSAIDIRDMRCKPVLCSGPYQQVHGSSPLSQRNIHLRSQKHFLFH
jgi:hypothetical protein